MGKRKISTLLGVLLLLVSAIAGVMVIGSETAFLPRARPEFIPQQVKLTNLSDSGFSVSWVTESPAIGFIKIGPDASNLNVTVTDDRDQLTGESGEFKTHHVTVQGLEPGKKYYFKLGSQGKQLYDNDGSPFEVSTLTSVSPPSTVDVANGTVLNPAQAPAEGVLIYLTLPGALPLSTLAKQNGNWAVTISNARVRGSNQYVTYDPVNTKIEILVRNDVTEIASVTTTTANDQPVPTIILGQNEALEAGNEQSGKTPESKFSFTPIEVSEPEKDKTIAILNPERNGQVINQPQPQFRGVAPSNTVVTVTLQANTIYTETVTSNSEGFWTWTPPGLLPGGNSSLTATYNDEEGILHTANRNFVVSSTTSSQVAYEATPSAQISPTVRPTATPRPQATVTVRATSAPTSAPTVRQPSPTTQVTTQPKISPTSVPTLIPTSVPSELPPAGTVNPSIFLFMIGSSLLLTGIYFVSRH